MPTIAEQKLGFRPAHKELSQDRRLNRCVITSYSIHYTKLYDFKWRSKYGGATVQDVKRLRELEAENAKLKRMYAELALENAAIKDVLNRKW